MADEKPSVIILHGDDSFGMNEELRKYLGRYTDPSLAEMNVARLSARTASMESVSTAIQALPFLSERRLVILTDALDLARGSGGQQRLERVLDQVPPTTGLVLVLDDFIERGDWKNVPLGDPRKHTKPHWLRQWAGQAGGRAYWKEFRQPSPGNMPAWIIQAVKAAGGQFTREAASQLAEAVGSDTALASQEIEKLLTYVDFSRPVERDDVTALTVAGHQASVFDFVDSLAAGDRGRALGLLRRLLFDQDAISLFGMVVRQYRLLIQARDALDHGQGVETLAGLGMNRPLATRMLAQAQRFNIQQLRDIYRQLLEIDIQYKNSQVSYELALEMLAAEQ